MSFETQPCERTGENVGENVGDSEYEKPAHTPCRRVIPVVLAGGSGTRLWPMSREHYPKQLIDVIGSDTLLQATVHRMDGFPGNCPGSWELDDAPLVVCGADLGFIIDEQLRGLAAKFPRDCGWHGAGVDGIEVAPRGQNVWPAPSGSAGRSGQDEAAIQSGKQGRSLALTAKVDAGSQITGDGCQHSCAVWAWSLGSVYQFCR